MARMSNTINAYTNSDNSEFIDYNATTGNDTSMYSYDDYENDSDQSVIKVFSMVIYSVAFLLGTTGNGLVIWFTLFRMKKTVNVVWFLNLAIADFIFTFFLPLSITFTALDFHWPFGNFMCKFNSTLAFLNLYASVFLLSVISIDRCMSVIFPVWCQNHRTTRLAVIVVLIIWFLALILSVPYFIFRDTEYDEGKVFCFNNFGDDGISRHRDTVIARFFIGFLIPFSIIISCYTVIALRIHRNHSVRSTKPFRIIVAVIISFFVCWIPYHIFSFLELFTNHWTHLNSVIENGIPFTSSLAFVNSCVNPILYVFIGRDFKQKIWVSIQSIFERAFTEDSVQTDFKSKTKSTSDSHLV